MNTSEFSSFYDLSMLFYHSFDFFLHSCQYSIWFFCTQSIHSFIYLFSSLVFKQDLRPIYPVIFSHVFLQPFQKQTKLFRCPLDKYTRGLQSGKKGLMSVFRVLPDPIAQSIAITHDLYVSLGWNFGCDELIILSMFLEHLDKSVFFLL